MAKAIYRVLTSTVEQENAALTDYNASAYTMAACPHTTGWTAENATAWAYTEGAALASGTLIRVQRQTSQRGGWQPHRAYVVGADGIVRRTDR